MGMPYSSNAKTCCRNILRKGFVFLDSSFHGMCIQHRAYAGENIAGLGHAGSTLQLITAVFLPKIFWLSPVPKIKLVHVRMYHHITATATAIVVLVVIVHLVIWKSGFAIFFFPINFFFIFSIL